MKKEIGVNIYQYKETGGWRQQVKQFYYSNKNLIAGDITISSITISEEEAQSVIQKLGLVKDETDKFINYNCKAHIRMMRIYKAVADKFRDREQKENLQPA
jgi:hypothetical protein